MMDNGAITVRGLVLDVEHKAGTTTKGQPYSFHIVSVLTGKSVSEVRYGDSYEGAVPKEGDRVELEVSLDIFNNRQQIEARQPVRAAGQRLAPTA